jgi:small ligand-binding sensory domain FIST
MRNDFAVVGHWDGLFDEQGLTTWADNLRQQLAAPTVSLGLLFVTPEFFPHASNLLELLRLHARIPLLVGCSSQALICGPRELEEKRGLVLGLYYLPETQLTATHFTQTEVEEATGPEYWWSKTGVSPEANRGWLVFLDPVQLDSETWLAHWNQSYPNHTIVGGLASGAPGALQSQVYLNGEVFDQGGVAISCEGQTHIQGVLSQGCTPIGETWTITKADRNLIREIGNRKAYQVLVDTYYGLGPEDQQKTRGNLLVGLVVNEYMEDYHRGDFLIRNLIAADPVSGSLAIGAFPRMGQTIQFQRRDAAAATEDLHAVLQRAREQLKDSQIYGGCLCICNGRGQRMFGESSHDARLVQESLGPLPMTGFFCNGEIGPVGERSFIHGFTTALALFVRG